MFASRLAIRLDSWGVGCFNPGMIDGCGREIDHLRLSLTDRCNLACKYCVPEGFKPSQSASKGIDPDFAFETVRWLSERHGIRHVRLTGGEPLLCVGLIPLLERISGLKELTEVTLTTNAQALRSKARPLFEAGLERINISLDTLDPRRFAQLTRGGDIVHTLSGIEAAIDVGLTPVKINVVAQRGLNEDELLPIAEWGLARGCVVRYLEVMPLGPLLHVTDQHLVPASEILERLSERLDIREIPQPIGQPATDYAVKGRDVSGVIGIIAHTTVPFCSRCRRLRLTAVGEIVPCLHDSRRFDLMPHWNGRSLDIDAADALLREAVEGKAAVGPGAQSLTMLSLGG